MIPTIRLAPLPLFLAVMLALGFAGGLFAFLTFPAHPASAQQPDDKPNLIVSPTTLNLTEGDTEWTAYTIVFDKNPEAIGDVNGDGVDDFECGDTAWVWAGDFSETDVEFRWESSGTSFTSGGLNNEGECVGGNWDRPKTFYVKAQADEDDVPDPPVVLTHEVWGKDVETVLTTSETPSVTVTIFEKDITEPSVSIAAGSSVQEGTPVEFTLTRAHDDMANALTVNVSVSQTGSVLIGSGGGPVRFGANEATKTMTLETGNDNVVEDDGTVTATITAPSGYVVAGPASATVTVTDNDTAELSLSVNPASIAEGEISTVTVSITNAVTFPDDQEITLDFTGSTAGAADYTAMPETLTLRSGQSEVSATITAVDDEDNEPVETISVTARHDGTVTSRQTITIQASDAGAPVPVWSATMTVGEDVNQGTTYLGYDSNTDPDTGSLTQTMFSVEGDDYTVRSLFLKITGSGTILLFVTNADLVTGFVLDLDGQQHLPTEASGTLSSYEWSDAALNWSNGQSVNVKLSVFDPSLLRVSMSEMTETDAKAVVATDNANGSTVHLRYRSVGATAWSAPNPPSKNVLPGTTAVTLDLTGLVEDTTYEVQASFDGSFPTGSIVSTTFTATRVLPKASFASASYRVNEEGSVTVRVNLSIPAVQTTTVPITFGGTAESNDYNVTGLTANNELVIEVGEGQKSFTINTRSDQDRANETINLGFGTLTGVEAGSQSTTRVTINDTTPAPTPPPTSTEPSVSIAAGSSVKEGTPVEFTVRRANDDVANPLTVNVSVSQTGSVLIGSAAGQVSVRFEANEATKTLTLDTEDDNVVEEDGIVTATITAPSGYQVAGPASATVNVMDNDEDMVTTVQDQEGMVALSSMTPVVGVELTGTLTDPDVVTEDTVTWQWSKSMTMGGTFEDIDGATMMTYTPVAADDATDVGYYLRATAMYTDGHGPGKMAMATTDMMVTMNAAPMFAEETTTREVAENTAAGMNIGAPVMATDADHDTLTYTLSGSDMASFDIDAATGQLMTKDMLDYEMPRGEAMSDDNTNDYMVTVTATDDSGAPNNSASIMVTIMVTDVEDELVATYDANRNGTIEKSEVIAAINDYLFGEGAAAISKADVIRLINMYLFG